MSSATFEIWAAIHNALDTAEGIGDRKGVMTEMCFEPHFPDVGKVSVQILHRGVSTYNELVDQHLLEVQVITSAKGNVLGRNPSEYDIANRIWTIQDIIRSTLHGNTLDNRVFGGVNVSHQAIGRHPKDTMMFMGITQLVCLVVKDTDDVLFTDKKRFYIGTPAYNNGDYLDVTWTELTRDFDIFPEKSSIEPDWDDSSRSVTNIWFTREQHIINARVQRASLSTLALYFGKNVEQDDSISHLHTSGQAGDIPTKAGLVVNLLSDGSYAKMYFPKMKYIPLESGHLPILNLRFTSIKDDNYQNDFVYGKTIIDTNTTPWNN